MGKIFLIGDSITAGAWDEHGGWAARLIDRIIARTMMAENDESNFYCLPQNLGVSGNTVPDILDRLEKEVGARTDPNNSEEVIQLVFAIGTNDTVYLVNEDRPRFTDTEFTANLNRLISMATNITPYVSFIGLPPVVDALLNPIPWAPDKAYINERVRQFEHIIQSVCEQNDLPFLPLHDQWMEMDDFADYLFDGVHPNTQGHALMAGQIGTFLLVDTFFSLHSS